MAWLPGAVRRDVGAPGNYSNGRMRSYLGVVLHVNDADSGDLYGWITGGSSDMSCHFQVLKDGTIYQYIDTQFSSWCQANGNDDYLSIETSGFPNEPLTAQQVTACASILAFVHAEHGIPLVVTDSVGQRGFIAHGDGGAAWGGHTACPGDLRKAQRTQILNLAGSGESTSSGAATPIGADEVVTPEDVKAIAGAAAAAVWTADFSGHGFAAPASTVLANTLKNATTAAAADPMGESMTRAGVGPAPIQVWIADARNLAAAANDNAAKALTVATATAAKVDQILAALAGLQSQAPAPAADPNATVVALGEAISRGAKVA